MLCFESEMYADADCGHRCHWLFGCVFVLYFFVFDGKQESFLNKIRDIPKSFLSEIPLRMGTLPTARRSALVCC